MPADTSNTERIRHLKAKTQAGSEPTDESTLLSRKFGKQTYYRQQGNGAVVAELCCSTILSNPGVSGSINTFTITWNQTVSDLPTITNYTSSSTFEYFTPQTITVDQAGNGSCEIFVAVVPDANVVVTLTLLGYSLQFTLVDVRGD